MVNMDSGEEVRKVLGTPTFFLSSLESVPNQCAVLNTPSRITLEIIQLLRSNTTKSINGEILV